MSRDLGPAADLTRTRPAVLLTVLAVILAVLVAALPFSSQGARAADVTWAEYASNPVFTPPVTTYKEYYPCVLYDASRFSSHGASYYYKMWYGDGEGHLVAVTYSNDGISWTAPVQTAGILSNGYHAQVIYVPGGFSDGGSTYYYRIWYWDANADLYSINAIRTADSGDGVNWEKDKPLTQDATAQIITGGPDWNRGSYGPVSVLYNATATNTGTNPFDYTYAMYYDATTGGAEVMGLGYSADGTHFYRYGSGPVLGVGANGAWDGPSPALPNSWYDTAGTVIKGNDGIWRMWYSAWQYVGGPGLFGNYGIGYATSTDGINWTRDPDNPIFYVTDGKAWRDARTYTPSVLYSPTRFDGHGEASSYKMWFTGQTSAAGQAAAIGYASSSSPELSLAKSSSPPGTLDRGQVVTYTLSASNSGNQSATACTIADAVPSYTDYVPNSTTLNGAPVADAGGTTPLAAGMPVKSPGQPAGAIAASEQAVVTFQVKLSDDLPQGAPVENDATLTADGESPIEASCINPTRSAVPITTWYLAEGSCAWGFSTYISIENPNTSSVTARITYMGKGSGGNPGFIKTRDVVLPPRSQTTVIAGDDIGFPTDFSTKVQCLDGKTIAVDRTMIWPSGGGEEGAHNSIGVTAPAKAWYLAEGSSAWGFECWLLIQNPGPSEANVRLTYMIEGSGPASFAKKVPAYSRDTFNMADDIGAKDASIEVTSDQPVIPERSMYTHWNSPETGALVRREGHDSIGTTAPATDYYLAEGTTAWGFTTYVLVQNPNSQPANVTLTYHTVSGPVSDPSFTMPPHSRKTVRVNDTHPNLDLSTWVHGDRPIIAERAMYWGGSSASGEACHDSIGMASPPHHLLPAGRTDFQRTRDLDPRAEPELLGRDG